MRITWEDALGAVPVSKHYPLRNPPAQSARPSLFKCKIFNTLTRGLDSFKKR